MRTYKAAFLNECPGLVVDIDEASFGTLSVRPRRRAGSRMTKSQRDSHQKRVTFPAWPKKLQ